MANGKKNLPITIILTGLLTLSVVTNAYFLLNRTQTRKPTVAEVIDGDTFTLTTGERVRLLGVDAPEEDRCMAIEAKEYLSTLIDGKTVELTETKLDNYKRTMALVTSNGQLINTAMLRAGYARPDYTKNSQSDEMKERYHEAVTANRGIHSAVCKKTSSDTPSDSACVIKGNYDRGTGKQYYHLPQCRHYKQVVMNLDVGDTYFCTEAEASAAGFVIASDCTR